MWLLLGAALMMPASGWADPVTILSVDRFAITGAFVGAGPDGSTSDTQRDGNALVSTSTFAAPEGAATATSTLFTTITERSFSGSGGASARQQTTTFFSGASGHSSLLVNFELSQPQQFNFAGTFTSTGMATNSIYSYWSAVIFVAPATRDGVKFLDINSFDSATRTLQGVLPIGRYGFALDAVANTNTAGTFVSEAQHEFNLRFSDPNGVAPTPEPGSMVLAGSGLVGLIALVRRKLGRDARRHS